MSRIVTVLAMVGMVAAVLSGCSSDPTASEEYRELQQRYAEIEQVLADAEEAPAAVPGSGVMTPVGDLPEGVVPVFGFSSGCSPQVRLADTVDGVQIYEGSFVCDLTYSDPRISGVVDWELTGEKYVLYLATESLPETARMEGIGVITTADGGTWRGKGFGVDLWDRDGNLRTVIYTEYLGEGEYEGLVFREWTMQSPTLYDSGSPTPGSGYMGSGWIETIPDPGS